MTTFNDTLAIIDRYINNWNDYDFNELIWTRPISEGKATVAEVTGHLLYWDKYLISSVIPSVVSGGGMEFPDFDSYNKLGYAYARSVSREILVDEFMQTRKELRELLLESKEFIESPTTANGVSHSPHSGQPYTLLYIIEEFIEHDEHHRMQIDALR